MKQSMVNEEIHYAGLAGPGSQMIGEEEEKEVLEVLRSKILVRDRFEKVRKYHKIREFEDTFSQYMGAKRALAVVNATQGLVIALSALDIGPGDEVIVPAYTFIASVAAVVAAKAIPILAEIDETLGLDPRDVEAKITDRTKAIMPVQMKGSPCRMDELMAVARKHNLIVVEDVAQACGASYKGKKCGTIGDAGVFSFDYWKVITTGGGGMIITDNEEMYKTCVHYNDHGHERYRENEELGERPLIGLNFRLEEIEGALGLAQLRKLNWIISTMRRNSGKLLDGISDLKLFRPREIPDPEGDIGNGVTLIMNNASLGEQFHQKMQARGVEMEWLKESGWHNYCNWKQLLKKKTINKNGCPFTCPYYGKEVEYREGMCPRTDDLLARAVTINYNKMLHITDREIDELIKHVQEVCRELA